MPNESETELVISIINMQYKIQKKVGGALSVHGIGLTEYLVLNQLYTAKDQKMRRSDLAEQVGLSPSGITRMLRPMEKIGLVEKEDNPRDARVSLVALSKGGKRTIKEAQVSFGFAAKELFESMDNTRLSELSALLRFAAK